MPSKSKSTVSSIKSPNNKISKCAEVTWQDRRLSKKMMLTRILNFVVAYVSDACSSSDRLFLQFDIGSKASIFVRKTLSVRLRDRKMRSVFPARGKDRRFSMKMMLAAGYRNFAAACLNRGSLPEPRQENRTGGAVIIT